MIRLSSLPGVFAALALFTVTLAVSACSLTTGEAPAADEAVRTPTAADCAARGGEMQPVGRMQSLQCVIKYADAGKRCTDGADCQGDCRIESTPFPTEGQAAVGVCAANNQRFGCHATVEGGKATAALCVD